MPGSCCQTYPKCPSPRLITGTSPVSFSAPGNALIHWIIFGLLTPATLQAGAFFGGAAGGVFGEFVPQGVDKVLKHEIPVLIYDIGGAFTFETVNDQVKKSIKTKD